MAVDAHRTLVPLSYPPHTIAAACLFLTSFLTAELSVPGAPAFEAGWADRCLCDMEDVEGELGCRCICCFMTDNIPFRCLP